MTKCETCLGFFTVLLQCIEQKLSDRQMSVFIWVNVTFHSMEDFST